MFNPITPQELAPGNVPLLTAFVATGRGLSHPSHSSAARARL
jgi:hypothetical protein